MNNPKNRSSIRYSIIIPTRDRYGDIKKCIDSLLTIRVQNLSHEIIIIDNGSTDGTHEYLERITASNEYIYSYYIREPGLHNGRHLGLKKSKGDILIYLDDDVTVTNDWLLAIHESFKDPNVVLAGGRVRPYFETNPPDWILAMWKKDEMGYRKIDSISVLDLGNDHKYISPLLVFGCNFAIRKKTLLEAGGFHPDGMPSEKIKYRGDGETHVAKYISSKNYLTSYNPNNIVYHSVNKNRMSKHYFVKRAFNQGISDSYTFIRGGKSFILGNIMGRIFKYALLSIVLSRFENKIKASYLSGFIYHTLETRRDKELLNWVFKNSYMDK
jgi:glucosyl-dolichyl phosphate glucuronosyltransferase